MSQTEKENLEKSKKEKGRRPSSDKTETITPDPSQLQQSGAELSPSAADPGHVKPTNTGPSDPAAQAKSGPGQLKLTIPFSWFFTITPNRLVS